MEWYWPSSVDDLDLPGYHPVTEGDPAQVRRAAELMLAAERPVLYVGGGVLKARASRGAAALAERTGIPVVTTLMARGAFPDSHPQCLGMPGMHGNYTAVTAMQRADLLVSLGARFDDRVTGKIDAFAPDAKIIHVDIDPAELGKVRRPDVAIAGDCRAGDRRAPLGPRRPRAGRGRAGARLGRAAAARSLAPWWAQLRDWQEEFPLHYEPAADGGPIKPQMVVEALRDLSPADTVVASGVGQHQMWASQYWRFDHPYTWVNSGGAGTMGFAVPAAIGAKVGRPDRTVWAVDGDGCFQMTAQELVTATAERIPVKIAILNNAYLGMVRQWQEMFYDERYSEVYLSPDLPDYVKWAEAMGCVGLRAESPRGGGAGHREGQRHRRPTGGHRLPHRRLREGVPDGAGRGVQRRHRGPPRAGGGADPVSGTAPARHHILSVLVENKAGVLARVAGLFSRRGFNIYSLAVAPTDEDERFSRITIVVDVESAPLEQIVHQLDKLVNVVSISQLAPADAVERELLLATVEAEPAERSQVIQLVGVFGGEVVDVGSGRASR